MNIRRIEQLIEKYETGQTSRKEEAVLRGYFQSDDVPEHLQPYQAVFQYCREMRTVRLSTEADLFAKIDFDEAGTMNQMKHRPVRPWNWSLKVAAGLILLLVGFSAGLVVQQDKSLPGQQVAMLQQEVQQMKKALVYGSYRQTSASERITAVGMATQIPRSEATGMLDDEISEILIHTMNNDDNTNVRQTAAEALFRFRDEPRIRKALVHSLAQQTDPLMQITLINILVKLKEKTAVREMQKMLMASTTQEVVRDQLRRGIAELAI